MPDPYADLRRGRACRSPQGATIFRSTHGGQPLQDSEVDSLLFLAQQSQCVSGY